MVSPLLRTRALNKSFGGIVATKDLSIEIFEGQICAVIGPNGAGKTTLVNLLSGNLRADSGDIIFEDDNVTGLSPSALCSRGIARSFQITSIFPEFSLLENVCFSVQASLGHSFHFWKDVRADERVINPAKEVLERIGLLSRANVLAGNLAHGEKRQLEIAMVLATRPKLLLLDEPMAGMGAEESRHLVTLLNELRSDYSMLLVEHDMDAVFALADKITVLVYGKSIAEGKPSEIKVNNAVLEAYLGSSES
ncbi:MAG: ABC transporter ATP-binding protein [Alphaproteobacteria bacterium]|jgi:branched-chain amino acid transport system ATP-binding protein|nr:ABC transporter ATP-binding protein [Alphaproteobacteria bacterium]|tara:strand:- start:1575 stop:2327 length:753 start_codon:yes stop_codon:yes gene_type:complete